jgi:hypothetical protein
VLVNSGGTPAPGFGTLDLSEGGAVRHEGIEIAGLNELVRACIARRS